MIDFPRLKESKTTPKLLRIEHKGNKRPMTKDNANSLRSAELTVESVQRIARRHYKTSRLGDLLYIHSLFSLPNFNVPYRSVALNFSDLKEFGYVSAKPRSQLFEFEFNVKTTKDLFKKLVKHNLI